MARVLYKKPIDTVRGAIDSVKEGRAKRARLVSRWHDYGEKSYSEDGSKWHEVYICRFHEGEWSDGATRNRELIKQAQRMAHEVEKDPISSAEWRRRYDEYMANRKPDEKEYHFYNYVYVMMYRKLRGG